MEAENHTIIICDPSSEGQTSFLRNNMFILPLIMQKWILVQRIRSDCSELMRY